MNERLRLPLSTTVTDILVCPGEFWVRFGGSCLIFQPLIYFLSLNQIIITFWISSLWRYSYRVQYFYGVWNTTAVSGKNEKNTFKLRIPRHNASRFILNLLDNNMHPRPWCFSILIMFVRRSRIKYFFQLIFLCFVYPKRTFVHF